MKSEKIVKTTSNAMNDVDLNDVKVVVEKTIKIIKDFLK